MRERERDPKVERGREKERKKKKKKRTHPAPDPDPLAAPHGRRRRAVDPELHVRAPPRLELLRGHRDGAPGARVEDGGAIDGAHKELAVGAVCGLDLGGVVEDVDGAVLEVAEGEGLAACVCVCVCV